MFFFKETEVTTNYDENASDDLKTQFEAWKDLTHSTDIGLYDFIHVDDDVCTTDFQSDEDILNNFATEMEALTLKN